MRLHQHEGGEFIYMLTGLLSVQIGGEQHTLDARDSMYFDSTHTPRLSSRRSKNLRRHVVTSP
jgi:quercetin dioxygenase-like cupin family protein